MEVSRRMVTVARKMAEQGITWRLGQRKRKFKSGFEPPREEKGTGWRGVSIRGAYEIDSYHQDMGKRRTRLDCQECQSAGAEYVVPVSRCHVAKMTYSYLYQNAAMIRHGRSLVLGSCTHAKPVASF